MRSSWKSWQWMDWSKKPRQQNYSKHERRIIAALVWSESCRGFFAFSAHLLYLVSTIMAQYIRTNTNIEPRGDGPNKEGQPAVRAWWILTDLASLVHVSDSNSMVQKVTLLKRWEVIVWARGNVAALLYSIQREIFLQCRESNRKLTSAGTQNGTKSRTIIRDTAKNGTCVILGDEPKYHAIACHSNLMGLCCNFREKSAWHMHWRM
jgi:hypothetical protein